MPQQIVNKGSGITPPSPVTGGGRLESTQEIKEPTPERLKISSIGLNAPIKATGLTPKGDMEVPNDTTALGWYKFGSRPGEVGSSVIAGYIYDYRGRPGAFININAVGLGNSIEVVDSKGTSTLFKVRDIRTYRSNEQPANAFDNIGSGIHLNLTTYNGWDSSKKTYAGRTVIFTDIQ